MYVCTHLQSLSIPVNPADLADDEVPGVGPHVVGAGVVLPAAEKLHITLEIIGASKRSNGNVQNCQRDFKKVFTLFNEGLYLSTQQRSFLC